MIDFAVSAVYFDAVGTLLFPRQPVAHTYAQFARRHGINVNEDAIATAFRDAFARQERLDSQHGWRTDELREKARWRAIVAEVVPVENSDTCFDELWSWYGKPEAWSANPQSGEVLIELVQRGLIVGIASNFDSRLAALIDEIPDLAIARDRCVISSRIGWRKPAREFFSAVVQNAGTPPDQVLYVGDDVRNDIQGARSAGLRSCLYDPEAQIDDGPSIRCLRDLLTV